MNSGIALPNVGPGPDPLSLSELEAEFAVLLLHRDFYCSECRQQVRRVKSRYEEFETRDAEVLSVLPEDRETAEEWQKQYHLPFPVVADAKKELGKRFDQPTRYGLLGRLHDVIGRMPAAIVLDLRWSDPIETFAHRGDSKTDRPRVDELLAAIDSAAAMGADGTPAAGETADGTPTDGESADREAVAQTTADSREPSTRPNTGGNGEPSARPDASTTGEPAARPDTERAAEPVAPTEAAAPPETDSAVEPDEEGEANEPVEPGDPAEAGEPVEAGDSDGATGDGGAVEATEEADPSPTAVPLQVPDGLDLPEEIELRRAGEDDAMPVIRVLQGSLLEIGSAAVRRAVARGDVLVAEADGWIIGALVLEDNHVDALAIRREYRKQGLGSALVETAVADIGGPVTADFRAGVRGFWQNLGFEIEKEGDRFYGIRS